MSAAEKLKWLGERNTDEELTIGAALMVLDVLPQIVAVVKAAENPCLFDYDAVGEQGRDLLIASLAALDEALP